MAVVSKSMQKSKPTSSTSNVSIEYNTGDRAPAEVKQLSLQCFLPSVHGDGEVDVSNSVHGDVDVFNSVHGDVDVFNSVHGDVDGFHQGTVNG